MFLRIGHANRCSNGNGSSGSSSNSSLLQPSLARQALSTSVKRLELSVLLPCTHICKSSGRSEAGLQQGLQDKCSDVVHPQQQTHQAAATQQEQIGTVTSSIHAVEVSEAAPAAAAAAAAAAAEFDATLSGSAINDRSQDPHSRQAAAATESAGLVAAAAVGEDVCAAAVDTASLDVAAGAEADAAATTASDTSHVGSSSTGSDPEQQQEQQQQQQEDPPKVVEFYSFYQQVDQQPVPVQLPPPGCTNDPPEQHPVLNKPRYKSPSFLQHFGAPKGSPYNFMSFLGPVEWHGGKYLVSPAALDDFLLPYFNTAFYAKRRLHIAQSYQGQPYK
jgi:hypothetical protein